MRVRASRTSSSLNGLMTAMTSFMIFLPGSVFGWRMIYSENRFLALNKLGGRPFRDHARRATKTRPGGCRHGLISITYRLMGQKLSWIVAAPTGRRRNCRHIRSERLSYRAFYQPDQGF